ncbi:MULTISPECIES: hypothetical protein [unclassified Amycolatopsis]|uniref:hypothetical protein n=1 Tax=unclassified Amycolatopsis TaxID=2618356 RepID=UPI002874A3F7|nr:MULTISPECIES: hypothetical protein [unclassified Amycolatopsis]MDS0131909.1 hypothetical protein [Amycolatopsis sp. 505]MDS0141353.1 hypothetical protein [Amycolatopsis sp. CM201R]
MDEPLIALEPGERLLWSGRPRRIAPTGLEWYRLVFGSVMVSGFAVAIGLPAPGAAVTFGSIGLAIVWAPVLWRLRTTRRAVYAVTDQRVVVADRVSGRIRTCEYLSDLESPVVRRDQDGGGRLTLTRRDGSVYLLGYSLPKKGQPAPIELFDVPDVDGLRDLIVHEQAAG